MAILDSCPVRSQQKVIRVFVALALISIAVAAIAAASDWVLERIIYEFTGNGMVSCNATVFGVMLPCTVGFWVSFLVPGGLIAAAISAVAFARTSASSFTGSPRFVARDRNLIAALGPAAMLQVSVCFPFSLLLTFWLMQGSAARSDGTWEIFSYVFYGERLFPYVLAALVGSVSFAVVLAAFSRHSHTGGAPSRLL